MVGAIKKLLTLKTNAIRLFKSIEDLFQKANVCLLFILPVNKAIQNLNIPSEKKDNWI